MKFKGRTVIVFILLTMTASVLVTLTAVDPSVMGKFSSRSGLVSAQNGSQGGLAKDESEKIDTVLSLIETKYLEKVDRANLIDGAINGMLGALGDPYSTYMEKKVADQFSESIEGSFTGIGAEVAMENGKITVVAPIRDSPAERAGLLPKDVLLSVNGESLDGLQLNEAVAKIRGPKGTKAKLQISRVGVSAPVQLVLTRDDIDVETVYASMLPDKIGKIEIRQFSMNTGERFTAELEKLEKQGMKGLIIDVRNNPGGVLPVVIGVAQPFIKAGEPIVQVEDRNGEVDKTLSKGTGKNYPISVLINKGSASASEVLAGALKEKAGANLIGETTFGKGTVQVSYNKVLKDGSLVKMTIAKWLTPDGNWIHTTGIKPDLEVLPPEFYSAPRLSKSETLQPEMLGDEVRSMQLMLAGLGYKLDRTDGYYSAGTLKAVKEFQHDAGLTETGKVDKNTAAKLEEQIITWVRDENNDKQLAAAVSDVKKRLGAK
ncbi:PDZ domain-containing protein [Paenibacillaceae bacterium]|nr:PDZ domain-containing protein [Paenibacillaceae bacterium]